MGNYGLGGYGGFMGGYQPCDMGCEYPRKGGNTFALIVVLFILLIIIGAQFNHKKC